jgi:hypothetical protein
VSFPGSAFLGAAPSGGMVSTHKAATVLRASAEPGLRGQPVLVTGDLRQGSGAPVMNAPVTVAWASGETANTTTDEAGQWLAELPALEEPGLHGFNATYPGEALFQPAAAAGETAVLVPTRITLAGGTLAFSADGKAQGQALTGNLTDERGAGLPGRHLDIQLVTPAGVNATLLSATTDLRGAFRLLAADAPLPLPGMWTARVSFPGSATETPADASGSFRVRHTVQVRLQRVPGAVDPGHPTTVQGVLEGSSDQVGAVDLRLGFGGQTDLAHVAAVAGRPWSISFQAPLLANGSYQLTVDGTGQPDVTVLGDARAVQVT